MSYVKKMKKSIQAGVDLARMDQEREIEERKFREEERKRKLEEKRLEAEQERKEYLALSEEEQRDVDRMRRSLDALKRDEMISESIPFGVRLGRVVGTISPKIRTGLETGRSVIREIGEFQKSLPKTPPSVTGSYKGQYDLFSPVGSSLYPDRQKDTIKRPSGGHTPPIGLFRIDPPRDFNFDQFYLAPRGKGGIKPQSGLQGMDDLFDYGALSPIKRTKQNKRRKQK